MDISLFLLHIMAYFGIFAHQQYLKAKCFLFLPQEFVQLHISSLKHYDSTLSVNLQTLMMSSAVIFDSRLAVQMSWSYLGGRQKSQGISLFKLAKKWL